MANIEVKMAEKCCLNCANLLTCPDILTYKCKKYEKAEINKSALSEMIHKIADAVKLLEMEINIAEKIDLIPKEKVKTEEKHSIPEGMTEEQFRNILKETNMTPEEWEQLPTQAKENILKVVQKDSKRNIMPFCSRRNKHIIELVEQGKGVNEIAQELNLKPETVEKELEYLLKNGMLKAHPS